jgi:hypothetical protein
MTEIDFSQFVPKMYEMNPETEDVLGSSLDLKEGMVVLVESPNVRLDVAHHQKQFERLGSLVSLDDGILSELRKVNRWCKVTKIRNYGKNQSISFVGVYEDGVKRQRFADPQSAWIVKLDSLPEVSEDVVECLDEPVITRGPLGDYPVDATGIVIFGEKKYKRYKHEEIEQARGYMTDSDPVVAETCGPWAEWMAKRTLSLPQMDEIFPSARKSSSEEI